MGGGWEKIFCGRDKEAMCLLDSLTLSGLALFVTCM